MNKNIEEVHSLIDKHFKRSKASIVEIGIKKNDEVSIYKLHGNNTDQVDLFGLGSVSKTIIATYITKLVNESKIALHKRVDDYMELNPKITYPTILQLATHTSGYHAFIPLFPSIFYFIRNGFNKKNFYANLDEVWFLKSVKRIRPLRKKKYRYSDYNYAVLALLIEHIEQKPYKEVIIEFLQKEIGMMETCYGSHKLTKNHTYSWYWEDDNPFLASGGLFSTTTDMLKFLSYQINNHDKLSISHEKYHRMNLHKNVYTGFSWNAFMKGTFYWHIGGQGRFRSYALFDTKRNICISILSTVDIDLQHIGRLGSSLYRNVKRNYKVAIEFLDLFSEKSIL